MESRTALILAISTAAAAVALVAADTVYGVRAKLETLDDGEWLLVQETESAYERSYASPRPFGLDGCATPTLRFTVDNHKPFPDTVTVEASWYDHSGTGRNARIFRETWDLGAFEARTREFTVPEEARPPTVPGDPPYKPPAQVNVAIEDVRSGYFGACVTFPEASR